MNIFSWFFEIPMRSRDSLPALFCIALLSLLVSTTSCKKKEEFSVDIEVNTLSRDEVVISNKGDLTVGFGHLIAYDIAGACVEDTLPIIKPGNSVRIKLSRMNLLGVQDGSKVLYKNIYFKWHAPFEKFELNTFINNGKDSRYSKTINLAEKKEDAFKVEYSEDRILLKNVSPYPVSDAVVVVIASENKPYASLPAYLLPGQKVSVPITSFSEVAYNVVGKPFQPKRLTKGKYSRIEVRARAMSGKVWGQSVYPNW